jgi:hypothetical protein
MKRARRFMFEHALTGLDLSQIRDSTARNSMEHFDERPDEASATAAEEGGTWGYNIVLSHRSVFTHPLRPIRLYIANERRFENLNWSAQLGKLRDEAQAVLQRLRELDLIPEEPGALLIPTISRASSTARR